MINQDNGRAAYMDEKIHAIHVATARRKGFKTVQRLRRKVGPQFIDQCLTLLDRHEREIDALCGYDHDR